MIVYCEKKSCDYPMLALPNSSIEKMNCDNFVVSSEWHTIGSKEVGFSLSVGREYNVYGLLQHLGQIRFLLMDDNNIPGFFPSVLFWIRKGDIPTGWIAQKYEIANKDLLIITDPMVISSYEDLKSIIECKKMELKRC